VSFMPQDPQQREKLAKWIHMLVNPLNTAQPIELREKRNLYLFIISWGLMTGTVTEFMNIARIQHLKVDKPKKSKFHRVAGMKGQMAPDKPPIADEHGMPFNLKDAIAPLKLVKAEDVMFRAEWENAAYWTIRLQNLRDAEKALIKSSKHRVAATTKKVDNKCTVHGPNDECPKDLIDNKIGKCLDKQFEYLLALGEMYKEWFMYNRNKSHRINLWLQALAAIDSTFCAHMKGIRNDYMMLLAGYLCHAELKGPFEDMPGDRLHPLSQAIATYLGKRQIQSDENSKVPLNPASDTIESFMNNVPLIEEGAFALLSLSGNLFSSLM
jgi:Domain of unknown function (DUF4485)